MIYYLNGASPSGKAAVFGTAIRRFESFRPRFYKDDDIFKINYSKIYTKYINSFFY